MFAPMSALFVSTLLITALDRRQPAPRVWKADVRVQALELSEAKLGAGGVKGGPLSVHIVVTTESDDVARAVRVEVMLPIGVGVLRVPSGCRPSPSPVTALNARVTCELGDLPVRALRELLITTTARVSNAPLHVAVFALSDTPDPFPANNFADKALP
jgi:Domain of unknown function DUF11